MKVVKQVRWDMNGLGGNQHGPKGNATERGTKLGGRGAGTLSPMGCLEHGIHAVHRSWIVASG